MSYPIRQEYLISYDVEDNKIRTRIFKELGKHGLRPVQKSVFWGYLTLAEVDAIKRYLNVSLENTDKVFLTHSNFKRQGAELLYRPQRRRLQGLGGAPCYLAFQST